MSFTAVLKEATYYARRHPQATLRGFIGMLDDLPAVVTDLANADRTAAESARP